MKIYNSNYLKMRNASELRGLFILVCMALFMFWISACSKPKSAPLMNPPPEQVVVTESAEHVGFDITPKAEIVFVIDNSGSMAKHIQRLSENIDVFVNAFSKNNPLVYNLAVMSVYDARTFSSDKYKQKWGGTDKVFSIGEFRQVKSNEKTVVPNKYFISSKDENVALLLRHTLKIGVQGMDIGGPSIEESFSPVAAAYGFSGLKVDDAIAERQKDFFMGADSYKIIFFVTDARDASDISATELYDQMLRKAGGDRSKVMTFGAIIPSYATNCERDPGAYPGYVYSIEQLLGLSKKVNEPTNMVSLCESFGEGLSNFGKSIRERTISQIIELKERIPVMMNPSQDPADVCRTSLNGEKRTYDHLHVCYGTQEIPLETAKGIVGYRYIPYSKRDKFNSDQKVNAIRINPDFQFDLSQEGAKIRLLYTAANPRLVH